MYRDMPTVCPFLIGNSCACTCCEIAGVKCPAPAPPPGETRAPTPPPTCPQGEIACPAPLPPPPTPFPTPIYSDGVDVTTCKKSWDGRIHCRTTKMTKTGAIIAGSICVAVAIVICICKYVYCEANASDQPPQLKGPQGRYRPSKRQPRGRQTVNVENESVVVMGYEPVFKVPATEKAGYKVGRFTVVEQSSAPKRKASPPAFEPEVTARDGEASPPKYSDRYPANPQSPGTLKMQYPCGTPEFLQYRAKISMV